MIFQDVNGRVEMRNQPLWRSSGSSSGLRTSSGSLTKDIELLQMVVERTGESIKIKVRTSSPCSMRSCAARYARIPPDDQPPRWYRPLGCRRRNSARYISITSSSVWRDISSGDRRKGQLRPITQVSGLIRGKAAYDVQDPQPSGKKNRVLRVLQGRPCRMIDVAIADGVLHSQGGDLSQSECL